MESPLLFLGQSVVGDGLDGAREHGEFGTACAFSLLGLFWLHVVDAFLGRRVLEKRHLLGLFGVFLQEALDLSVGGGRNGREER